MGSDQSTLPAGGQTNRTRQREDSLYSNLVTKPVSSGTAGQTARQQTVGQDPRQSMPSEQGVGTKHNIIVVADGSVVVKDPDPELTRLRTIPTFLPLLKSSLNATSRPQEQDLFASLDHRKLLMMCLRYQEHLKQLSEAVAFDQNALGVRIKEVSHSVQIQQSRLAERQKKYHKYVEQFQRVTDITMTLSKVKTAMDDIVPCLDHLNQLLPATEQLEPFSLILGNSSIQSD